MRGAIPPLPQYVFMAWCLIKHRDNFTFTLIADFSNIWSITGQLGHRFSIQEMLVSSVELYKKTCGHRLRSTGLKRS
jgi:hypothetical protein